MRPMKCRGMHIYELATFVKGSKGIINALCIYVVYNRLKCFFNGVSITHTPKDLFSLYFVFGYLYFITLLFDISYQCHNNNDNG